MSIEAEIQHIVDQETRAWDERDVESLLDDTILPPAAAPSTRKR